MRHKPTFPAARAASFPPTNSKSAPQPASVHFDISRITLHGYTAANQRRFTHSLQNSLADLVAARHDYDWSSATSLKIRRLSGGKLKPGTSPEDAAMHVAQQIVQQALQIGGGRHDA